jgi:hypothetical protein
LNPSLIWTPSSIISPIYSRTDLPKKWADLRLRDMDWFYQCVANVDDCSRNYLYGNAFYVSSQNEWEQFYEDDLFYNSGWKNEYGLGMGAYFGESDLKKMNLREVTETLEIFGHTFETIVSFLMLVLILIG